MCQGVLSFTKKYSKQALEETCRQALALGKTTVHEYQRRLKRTCSAVLLILDDFLLHTITDECEVKILFEILKKRSEISLSTIICSQREPASWSTILNDEVVANAILKRATRHYTVVIKPTMAD